MSLIIGIFRSFKESSDETTTARHEDYTSSRFSSGLALIGTLIIWIFFPILVFDHADAQVSANSIYTGPYTIMFALASSTLTTVMISLLFN